MRLGSVIAGVGLLVLGGLGGYLLAPRAEGPVAEKPRSADVPKKTIDDKGESASLKALRARIRDLEARLAAKDGEIVAATNALAADRPLEPPRHENFRERLERLKTDDPARYAQITNNMAQWRRRRAEQQEARMEFLTSVDTSRMSSAAKGVHASLQRYATEREEIERQLQNENLTDDERHELFERMHEANRQVMALNGVERQNLIEETAKNLGFEGDDVKDIAATMQEIIRATDNGFGPHGGHGRHGRGGRGPGGPRPPR